MNTAGEQLQAWLKTPEGQDALRRGKERAKCHPLNRKFRNKLARLVKALALDAKPSRTP